MILPPTLEVLAPGAYASVQDAGRRGFRRVGVPWAGVLDPRLMRLANALVGNAGDAPVIECFDGGLKLAARGAAVRLAVAGDAELLLERGGELQRLESWRSLTLADGDCLRVQKLPHGRIAVVAAEGMLVPRILGSASTYSRAGLGGVLVAGAQLQVAPASVRLEHILPEPPRPSAAPMRVIAGPQADYFTAAALDAFVSSDYRVSVEADRMGVRLEGSALAHLDRREIVSDATVPGSVQVPGNGQPIVLLADAQTAGGYPKIATVISTDLPRLAATRPGQSLRFAWVEALEGEGLARAAEAETRALLGAIRPLLPDGVDEAALYTCNLVSGAIDALSPEYRSLAGGGKA